MGFEVEMDRRGTGERIERYSVEEIVIEDYF